MNYEDHYSALRGFEADQKAWNNQRARRRQKVRRNVSWLLAGLSCLGLGLLLFYAIHYANNL